MWIIIIYILSLFSFCKKIYINDFFSKDICKIIVKKTEPNQKKVEKNTKKEHVKKRYLKKKIKKKNKKISDKKLNKVEVNIKNYYLIDKKFKKKYKVAVVKYKNKYYLMINNVFYKENDYIEDYLIYKIYLDKIILKKENKYYIWIL